MTTYKYDTSGNKYIFKSSIGKQAIVNLILVNKEGKEVQSNLDTVIDESKLYDEMVKTTANIFQERAAKNYEYAKIKNEELNKQNQELSNIIKNKKLLLKRCEFVEKVNVDELDGLVNILSGNVKYIIKHDIVNVFDKSIKNKENEIPSVSIGHNYKGEFSLRIGSYSDHSGSFYECKVAENDQEAYDILLQNFDNAFSKSNDFSKYQIDKFIASFGIVGLGIPERVLNIAKEMANKDIKRQIDYHESTLEKLRKEYSK